MEEDEEVMMDITLFQACCPLLLSTFHETLRLIEAATSVRAVVQLTTLTLTTGPSYNLTSPSVIQLPSGITHNSTTIWGENAGSFNAERFLPKKEARLDKAPRRAQSQAYVPFGGGKHLCP
jgi:cytochrome P450